MIQFEENIRIEHLASLHNFPTTVDVLRLDLIHPIISGNKWFKLKKYLQDATQLKKKIILTFGGAYSNHIIATAAAAKIFRFNSIGIIRGEKPKILSSTLSDAIEQGMKLFYASREDYKRKIVPADVYKIFDEKDIYTINEGGYGIKGIEGAASILANIDHSPYTHIIAAVGTGTTLGGLVTASHHHQKIIGVSVMKNNFSLEKEIEALLPKEKHQFTLLHDYSFGGYAKYNQTLFDFMNEWYKTTSIPSDFVYTGKLFYAINDLIEKNFFPAHSKLLAIHSGGLQGNRSLPKRTLIF